MKSKGNSFENIFGSGGPGTPKGGGAAGAEGGDEPTSIHKLFTAAMRGDLSLPLFAQELRDVHGLGITQAAARLLTSVDAGCGRLTFAQFQKAMQDEGDGYSQGGAAGGKTKYVDSACAIIEDNCGEARAPQPVQSTHRISTDISSDVTELLQQRTRVEKVAQAGGAFRTNPVRNTNTVSRGNPMMQLREEPPQPMGGADPDGDDAYGSREMANTATRMYVGGEIDKHAFEKFLAGTGMVLAKDSEVRKLIDRHEKTGDGKFVAFSKALQAELAKVQAAK
mmetsp:Transcript_45475/g.134596  ORF Transcript_45475/g.134596 Transcript_45475/m.134596 type:complete len:280 (+) Transcript_45475:110-949(+)